jgi:hypothetical protein
LARREYTLNRVPAIGETQGRAWFADEFLPAVYHTIRPHRRLVLLFDNAHLLIDAVARGDLAQDTFLMLAELLHRDAQLAAVLSLDAERELDLTAMQPLVGEVYRLTNLSPEECALLVPPDSAEAVYKATNGSPALVQRFAYYLYQGANLKAAAGVIYGNSQQEFREMWLRLPRSERLTLTAISSLLYADPLQGCEADAIGKWLVETDYALDNTAINAALRSLEYRDILSHGAKGYVPAGGFMQRWLLENARLETAAEPTTRRRWWVLALVVAGMLAMLLLWIALSGTAPPLSSDTPPTVTLVATP